MICECKNENKIITIPNVLSFLRIGMIPVIIWMYCEKQEFFIAGLLLIMSGFTDLLDGFIARKFCMISNLGKVLDPVADKLTQGVMMLCLISRFPYIIYPLLLFLLKEIFMGITGGLVIRKTGKVVGAKWHGKVSTCLLDTVMILHVFWYNIPYKLSIILLSICILFMVISMVLYGMDRIKELTRNKM